LLELSARISRRFIENLRGQAASLLKLPLADCMRGVIKLLIANNRENVALRQHLLAKIPRAAADDVGDDLEQSFVELVAGFIALRGNEARLTNPELTARILVNALDGVMEMLLQYSPELLDSETALNELTTLCTRYLQSS